MECPAWMPRWPDHDPNRPRRHFMLSRHNRTSLSHEERAWTGCLSRAPGKPAPDLHRRRHCRVRSWLSWTAPWSACFPARRTRVRAARPGSPLSRVLGLERAPCLHPRTAWNHTVVPPVFRGVVLPARPGSPEAAGDGRTSATDLPPRPGGPSNGSPRESPARCLACRQGCPCPPGPSCRPSTVAP